MSNSINEELRGELQRISFTYKLDNSLWSFKPNELMELIQHTVDKAVEESKQETIYAIMRGEHGHDEVSIINSLKKELKSLSGKE